MTTILLLAIQVLLSTGKPAKGAIIACAEIPAQNGEEGQDEPGGDWVPTDSAGRMFFEADPGTYHCTVRRKDGAPINWSGVLWFDAQHKQQQVVLDVAK